MSVPGLVLLGFRAADPFLFGLSLEVLLVVVVVVAGAVAVTWIALRQLKVTPPAWVVQVGWVLAVVFVCVLAIRLLFAML